MLVSVFCDSSFEVANKKPAKSRAPCFPCLETGDWIDQLITATHLVQVPVWLSMYLSIYREYLCDGLTDCIVKIHIVDPSGAFFVFRFAFFGPPFSDTHNDNSSSK